MELFTPLSQTGTSAASRLISGSSLQTEMVTDAMCEDPVQYTICRILSRN
jgi:hypothetical protein